MFKTRNAADKNREKEIRKTQNNLYRFLPQTGSSLVPLIQSSLNVIYDYKCSSTQARDFYQTKLQKKCLRLNT